MKTLTLKDRKEIDEIMLQRMQVQDRARQIQLQKLDNLLEESDTQLYVEEFTGTHPKRSIRKIIINTLKQLLP